MGKQAITPAFIAGGQGEPAFNGIETASSSWTVGAPLIFTSGKLAIAGTNPRLIAGIAYDAATGTTDAPVRYCPLLPGMVFEATLDSVSGGDALAQADVGGEFGITLTSGVWHLDTAKTVGRAVGAAIGGETTVAVVIGLRDPVGASTTDSPGPSGGVFNTGGARVYCVFLTEIQYSFSGLL